MTLISSGRWSGRPRDLNLRISKELNKFFFWRHGGGRLARMQCIGYHFEKQSGILHHDQVAFYGRYIDDCFSLVYAESANDAMKLISEMIKFDSCVIEWAVSDSSCQFLDSVIFKGKNNELRWRPYVKAGNNRERIPWVTHHPMDVRRGVYIGELSRLAVICSHRDIYIEAVKDLNNLFQTRGYPVPLIMSWCRKNMQEHWEKRFALTTMTKVFLY